MKRQRLAGIEKEMSRVISQVLFEEIKNPKIRGLVSVTNIRVTEDLKFADVYFRWLYRRRTDLCRQTPAALAAPGDPA